MPRGYQIGRNFEYRVINHLRKRGFFVMRSAGSKGVFDIIAVNKEIVLGIQCKLNDRLTKTEEERMLNVGEEFGIVPIFAYKFGKTQRFRELNSRLESSDIIDLLSDIAKLQE